MNKTRVEVDIIKEINNLKEENKMLKATVNRVQKENRKYIEALTVFSKSVDCIVSSDLTDEEYEYMDNLDKKNKE